MLIDSRNHPTSMKAIALTLFFALSSLAANLALACQYDVDCRPGAKCVKARGNMFGACKSVSAIGDARIFEGAETGSNPHGKRKIDLNHSFAQSCSFDSECSLGYRCARGTESRTGLCVRISGAPIESPKPAALPGTPAPKAAR